MEHTCDTEKAQLLESESNEKSYLKKATGVIAVFSAMLLFSSSATCVQLLERRIPDLELNTFRSGIPLLFYATGLLIMRRWPVIDRSKIAATLGYSLGISCSGLSQFVAVSFLPAAAAFCVCCTSGIISGIFIFALCWNETVTLKKVLFAGLCVCGVILRIQPWMQLKGYNQNGNTEKENSTYGSLHSLNETLCSIENSTDGSLHSLNETLCSIENSSQKINDEIGTTPEGNIIPCEQNETESLKGLQINNRGILYQKSSSTRLVSVIVGYGAAVSHGIFLELYVLVLKKYPYINKHPLEILFWALIVGTSISSIPMFLTETPVLSNNWFDVGMVIIHGVTCAGIWPLHMYGSGIINGNTVTIINSTKPVFMLISQYTVLSSILPGHRNWMEVVGVIFVLLGSSLSSVLEIVADSKWFFLFQTKVDDDNPRGIRWVFYKENSIM